MKQTDIVFESKDFKCTQRELLLSIPAELFYLTDMSLEERTEFLFDVKQAFNRVQRHLTNELNELNNKHMFK